MLQAGWRVEREGRQKKNEERQGQGSMVERENGRKMDREKEVERGR